MINENIKIGGDNVELIKFQELPINFDFVVDSSVISQPEPGLKAITECYWKIPVHRAASDFEVMLAVGKGYEIVSVIDNPSQEQFDKLKHLVENPNDDQTFNQISNLLYRDTFPVSGNGYLEVNRMLTGEINSIRHKPAHLFYKVRPVVNRPTHGWSMKKGMKREYFNRFGRIDVPSRPEVFHFVGDDYQFHDYQNLPAVASAYMECDLQGNLSRATNTYFKKGLMSQIMFITEGGEVQVKNMEKFHALLKENLFNTENQFGLIQFKTKSPEKVRIEKLTQDINGDTFIKTLSSTDKHILACHRISPELLGFTATGAGSFQAIDDLRTYMESVVYPHVEQFEAQINKVFRVGLGIKDWKIRYKRSEIMPKSQKAKTLLDFVKSLKDVPLSEDEKRQEYFQFKEILGLTGDA